MTDRQAEREELKRLQKANEHRCRHECPDTSNGAFEHDEGCTIARAALDLAERYEMVIRWALGEGEDFPNRPIGAGAYWWRRELRKRAFAGGTP